VKVLQATLGRPDRRESPLLGGPHHARPARGRSRHGRRGRRPGGGRLGGRQQLHAAAKVRGAGRTARGHLRPECRSREAALVCVGAGTV
jgi:hypothetical protein